MKRFEQLDHAAQRQVARKLAQRTQNPRVPGDALSGMKDCYKIKLRKAGIRLVYLVQDDKLVLLVLSAGQRERNEAYREAESELTKIND
jgi:mRNA interferase RelE/StbE